MNHPDPQTTPVWLWLLWAFGGAAAVVAAFIVIGWMLMMLLEWALGIGRKADDEQ